MALKPVHLVVKRHIGVGCRELYAAQFSSQSPPLPFVIGTVPFRPNYSHINSPRATRFQSPL